MQSFLEEVASALYSRYGDDVEQLTLLFPSHRAQVFFTDALSHCTRRAMWQPQFTSVDALMGELTELRATDRMRLLTELYKVYSQHHAEPFDKFYFWGDMLLSDFDTIDKYEIDASRLFRNISDLKEIESDTDYLSGEQLRVLEFWRTLGDEMTLTDEKRRFLELWRSLPAIYAEFTARLRSAGMAYTGMIYRSAAENIRFGKAQFASDRRYVVAGFNALSTCEMRLFEFMQSGDTTDFFWDYDNYYLMRERQEAGMFIRRNLPCFGQSAAISCDNMRNIASVEVISTGSNVAQCKYAAELLRQIAAKQGGQIGKETAIVLTDESLLMPLLYSLPQELGKINVTMGYPLRQTLAYSFAERLLELQNHSRAGKTDGDDTFYYTDVVGLLTHPYISTCAEVAQVLARVNEEHRIAVPRSTIAVGDRLTQLFTRHCEWSQLSSYLQAVLAAVVATDDGSDADDEYRAEYIALTINNLRSLHNLLPDCGVEITPAVYASLVRRHLQGVRIPFEGEPLSGVQVMGILETRNLDFRNVILLSMTDDNFPGSRAVQSSFIPYNLRFAYGLPATEHQEGVYAYYFYRLIQRAQNVCMLYSSHADERSTGEESRYIRQLEYETSLPIHHVKVGVELNATVIDQLAILKTGDVQERLKAFLTGEKSISPTAFSQYVKCPLRFYFSKIAGIRVDSDPEEGMDNQTFGTVLHGAAEYIYAQLLNLTEPAPRLEKMLCSGEVERAVLRSLRENFVHSKSELTREELDGENIVIYDIITRYLKQGIMSYDIRNPHFVTLDVERVITQPFEFTTADGSRASVLFGGKSDRVDSLSDGRLRVVDYKTGAPHLDFNGFDLLFAGNDAQRLTNIINTLLYAMMFSRELKRDVVPMLYYVRQMQNEDYSPEIIDRNNKISPALTSYEAVREQFEQYVDSTLRELFDFGQPFVPCADTKSCMQCDYNDICMRVKKGIK